jgi:cytochrome c oxidase subunit II
MKKTLRRHLLTVAALAAAFVILQHSSSGQNAAADKPHHIAVGASRFQFNPAEITVKKGEPVALALTAKDADHGLKIEELDVLLQVKKGSTEVATFTPKEAGTFIGQCAVFCGSGHGGMKLTVHVTE